MESGDLVLFYKGREGEEAEGKFVYAGRLLFKQYSKELGLALWPPKLGEEPWTCIFFLRDLQQVYIPVADIKEFAGYSDKFVVQGFMPLDEQGTAKILDKFGTVENFLKQYSPDKGTRVRDSENIDVTKPKPKQPAQTRRLDGIAGRVQAILDRKGQAILFGPPGTGKTHWAWKTAFDLAALQAFGRVFGELSLEEKVEVEGSATKPGLVRRCTFHPAYGYEDFLEGFRPQSSQQGHLLFERRDGVFKRICTDASQKPDRRFYLLIDEINRGDIPRIFGELLTSLELDKRGCDVTLPVSGDSFTVPPNLYLIGTMNTADRSIALLDTALRRRFGFIELMPDMDVFGSAAVEGSIPLGPWLNALNDRIRAHLGRDSRNRQIGHAYLLHSGKPVTEFSRFVRILAEDIIPLLEEYCYEDYGVLTQILGADMVDPSRQRIREELFAPPRREDLVRALLAPSPEIVTSSSAVEESEEENSEK